MIRRLFGLGVGFALLGGGPADAACPAAGSKQIAIAQGTIKVDGVLDDAIWKSACFITDFEQQQPVFGAPPSQRITVAVAIDSDTLYVAARMWATGPDDVGDALTQRDDMHQAERFIVSIDPTVTKRTAYSFAVSAAGVRADWVHTDDTQADRDATWNPVWRARTQRLPDGWSAELAMPLSQLRLSREPLPAWGINFNWYIPHRNEDVFWRAIPPDRTAWASMFGDLVELPPVKARLGLELLPYLATRLGVGEEVPGAPAHRIVGGLEAGLDAKFRPLPGLVVAATINPDFGQVDVDPAFVNLSAYEVVLPEKRPFFVENNALYANSGANFFYSRRIGALPRALPGSLAGSPIDAIDLPTQVRILGAAATGGYVASRTQVAALAAITAETTADAIAGGGRSSLVIAPLTAWSAARIEQQIGVSVIGATATAVRRQLDGTGLADLLPETAIAEGADAKLRSDDGTYELSAYVGSTAVLGSAAAIAALETSSAHYFQRPDLEHVDVNPAAKRMIGWTAGAFGSKRAGMWQGSIGAYGESPRYEPNDLGRLQSADDLGAAIDLNRIVTTPTKRVFSWNVGGGINQEWNFGGMRKPTTLYTSGSITFPKFSNAGADASLATPGLSDDLTRGGPAMAVGWAAHGGLHASTPNGRKKQLSATLGVDVSPTLAQGFSASATLAARVTSALRLDLTPSLSIGGDHRQYVDTIASAGGGDNTFGARYVFGHLRRKEAALELRATLSLSPDLVITLYAQPFASVGRYDQFGELAAAGSADLRTYGEVTNGVGTRDIVDGPARFSISEPDYTFVSLRSTAVMKWELAPGSTLFIVWQQARGGGSSLSHPLHAAVPDIFTQAGVHTFAVKLSYWFG